MDAQLNELLSSFLQDWKDKKQAEADQLEMQQYDDEANSVLRGMNAELRRENLDIKSENLALTRYNRLLSVRLGVSEKEVTHWKKSSQLSNYELSKVILAVSALVLLSTCVFSLADWFSSGFWSWPHASTFTIVALAAASVWINKSKGGV